VAHLERIYVHPQQRNLKGRGERTKMTISNRAHERNNILQNDDSL